ncbi:MAG: pseudouridine synthase [Bacteroidia bacterium]|nr:pseudouridine synthase [Bacteroidia bacterium]
MKESAVPETKSLYYALYKPVGVLSQMKAEHSWKKTLREVCDFPEGVQAMGRLDEDSEGLLLLTNDRVFNHETIQVKTIEKEYWVQVVGVPGDEHVQQWCSGVPIQLRGITYFTRPCNVHLLTEPVQVVPRVPHLLKHQKKASVWLSVTLTEGKNRQVRKMMAALGFPVVRLVRVRIGNLLLGNMQPGELRQIEKPW